MKQLSIMIKPASSLCNLRCKYCFYADEAKRRSVPSHGLMRQETVEALLNSLRADLTMGDRVQFIFQGGEPTVSGLAFFRNFFAEAARLEGIAVSYAFQTNGILLDEEWCKLFKENGVLVGVSLDLYKPAHDRVRTDAEGKGTYRRVLEAIGLLRAHGVEFNVLSTLTRELAAHPREAWEEILHLDIAYVQFTPCLGEMGDVDSPYAITPELFSSFYTELFSLWYADFCAGGRRSVKLFDDVVNLIILGTPTACGMDGRCRGQLVIEANGDAYPCDFYCLDEYQLGNITSATPSSLLKSEAMQRFLTRPREEMPACRACPYRRFCGGGCHRMRSEIYCSSGKGSCGYRAFLDSCGPTLLSLARAAKSTYMQSRS